MKVKTYLLAATFAASGLTSVLAQAPGSEQPGNNPPPPPAEGDRQKDRKGGFLQNLPPDVRKRFDDAREKALEDPKIQALRKASEQANREFFDAMRAKMQEIDPGLADIIKKNAPDGKLGREMGREGRDRDGRGGKAGFENLTEAERTQLLTAREKAKDDPAVKAARDKREAATTPEERQAAGEAFRETIDAAILKIDPSLEPVLKKLGPPAGAPPPPPPGGGEMAPPPPAQ